MSRRNGRPRLPALVRFRWFWLLPSLLLFTTCHQSTDDNATPTGGDARVDPNHPGHREAIKAISHGDDDMHEKITQCSKTNSSASNMGVTRRGDDCDFNRGCQALLLQPDTLTAGPSRPVELEVTLRDRGGCPMPTGILHLAVHLNFDRDHGRSQTDRIKFRTTSNLRERRNRPLADRTGGLPSLRQREDEVRSEVVVDGGHPVGALSEEPVRFDHCFGR